MNCTVRYGVAGVLFLLSLASLGYMVHAGGAAQARYEEGQQAELDLKARVESNLGAIQSESEAARYVAQLELIKEHYPTPLEVERTYSTYGGIAFVLAIVGILLVLATRMRRCGACDGGCGKPGHEASPSP